MNRAPGKVKIYRELVTPAGTVRISPIQVLECGPPSIFDRAAREWLRMHEHPEAPEGRSFSGPGASTGG